MCSLHNALAHVSSLSAEASELVQSLEPSLGNPIVTKLQGKIRELESRLRQMSLEAVPSKPRLSDIDAAQLHDTFQERIKTLDDVQLIAGYTDRTFWIDKSYDATVVISAVLIAEAQKRKLDVPGIWADLHATGRI